jgi:hypothetical protein
MSIAESHGDLAEGQRLSEAIGGSLRAGGDV